MMKEFEGQIAKILNEVKRLAKDQKKLTGFCIGNTRKVDSGGLFFSPIRITNKLISGSAVVCSIDQAIVIASAVDGCVDYILVDAEKKISHELYGADNVGNVERAVRETVKLSRVLTYKGNDITVDSIESFVVQMLSVGMRGIGGKKAAIIGAGNMGSKLALRLVERGMHVSLTRRNKEKLDAIVTALNIIKPTETISTVLAGSDNLSVAKGADLLVGLTPGTPVITKPMVEALAPGAIIIDGGKGCCESEAILSAKEIKIPIFRADIRPGFEGHIGMVLQTESIIQSGLGRRIVDGVAVVSGGLLANFGEVVVDSLVDPKSVYGVASGYGDFIRQLDGEQLRRLKVVNDFIKRNCSS